MDRVEVHGSAVIFDVVEDSRYFISRPETWRTFLRNVPRKGSCRLFVGHPLANGDGERINGKNLKEYTFAEVCWRVNLELVPNAG